MYFNENDSAIKGKAEYAGKLLRLMPLIDYVEDGIQPGAEIDVNDIGTYESQNLSYGANNKKWNTSTMSPFKWQVVVDQSSVNGDSVLTTTRSWAKVFIVVDALTYTSFSFMEYDIDGDGEMEPFVKFKNTGDGTARIGLASNSENIETNNAKFGDDETLVSGKNYCWYLVKAEDLEAVR